MWHDYFLVNWSISQSGNRAIGQSEKSIVALFRMNGRVASDSVDRTPLTARRHTAVG
jgi:hypothetical protein